MAGTLSDSPRMTSGQWALLSMLSFVWGCSFIFVNLAVRELPPMTIVALRVGIAALLLVPLALLQGHRFELSAKSLLDFTVLSLLQNVVPFVLFTTAQGSIPAGLAAILNATTPVFGLLLTWALTGERLDLGKMVGVGVGILGVAVLVGPQALAPTSSKVLTGVLLCLAAAARYGLSGVWGRRFRSIPPLKTSAGQLLTSTVIMVVLASIVDQPWHLAAPSGVAIAAVMALAVVSTALAYILFFKILVGAGPNNALLVTLLVPVSALVLGTLLLGERLAPSQLAGGLIIATGLLIIDGRPVRSIRRLIAPAR